MTVSYEIFVYGSLRRGARHHAVLGGAPMLATCVTEVGWALVDLGPYPALVREGTGHVVGERYRIDAAKLVELDVFEEHPEVYQRTRIRLEDGAEIWAYTMEAGRVAWAPRVASGDWIAYRGR